MKKLITSLLMTYSSIANAGSFNGSSYIHELKYLNKQNQDMLVSYVLGELNGILETDPNICAPIDLFTSYESTGKDISQLPMDLIKTATTQKDNTEVVYSERNDISFLMRAGLLRKYKCQSGKRNPLYKEISWPLK